MKKQRRAKPAREVQFVETGDADHLLVHVSHGVRMEIYRVPADDALLPWERFSPETEVPRMRWRREMTERLTISGDTVGPHRILVALWPDRKLRREGVARLLERHNRRERRRQ